MPISINTNIASLTAQKDLRRATDKMDRAMERLSTGFRINSSKDDAAGMAVSSKLNFKISSLVVAQNNGQMGASLLDSQEGVLNVLHENFCRIRELTEQAANGTYGTDSMKPIKLEVEARLNEISRIANSTEFNGKYLLNGSIAKDISLQVGIESNDNSVIKLSADLFKEATATAIVGVGAFAGKNIQEICEIAYKDDSSARTFLDTVDEALANVTDRITIIGGLQQRILSAIDSANIMATSMTAANSLIKDADIAEESSNYTKQQILKQISTSILATANQAPATALNLLS